MKVILTRRAQTDLRQIGLWIAKDNPPRSRTYVEEIRDACLALGPFPKKWPVVAQMSDGPMRRGLHGPYAIFYVIKPGRVTVLAVVHGSRLSDPGQIPDNP